MAAVFLMTEGFSTSNQFRRGEGDTFLRWQAASAPNEAASWQTKTYNEEKVQFDG